MKTKIATLALLTGLSLAINSCGTKSNEDKTANFTNDTTSTEVTAEVKSINSMDFHKNMISDQFYRTENADKSFVLSDILITGYEIWGKGKLYPDGAVILTGTAYNPLTKKYLQHFQEGQGSYGATLNGEKLERETSEESYNGSDEWIDSYSITLTDQSQVKLLKIYDPKKSSGNTHILGNSAPEGGFPDEKLDIKDLIKIEGVFKEIRSGSIRIEGAKIIN